jgi:hypothetical protein
MTQFDPDGQMDTDKSALKRRRRAIRQKNRRSQDFERSACQLPFPF